MKKLMYLIIVLAPVSLAGCLSGLTSKEAMLRTDTSATTENGVREQIEQADEIQEATGEITQVLEEIDGEAKSILNEVALTEKITESLIRIEESAEEIREQVDQAQLEQVRIEESLEDLEQANMRIAAAVGEIAGLEDLIEEYEQSDREVRKEALENLHSFITLFFVIGFGMLIGGAFLTFWVNGKLGGVVLAIGVLTVGFAAASQYYLEEIAVVGLVVLIIGFLASLGVVGWMLFDGKNDKKAIAEIVELIEETKEHLTLEERQEIFGRDGFASRLTSDITKKIVSQVKIKNGFKNLTRSKTS
tara:strand:+ start:107 stop:1018 length:912 start_codon:yes stop_codon:yes gene_type:complete